MGVTVTLELTVTTMLFCFSDMIHSLNRVEEILVKIPLDKEKQLQPERFCLDAIPEAWYTWQPTQVPHQSVSTNELWN